MAQWEGADDVRSQLEAERRSNGPKIFTNLALVCFILVFVMVILGLAGGWLNSLFNHAGYKSGWTERRVLSATGTADCQLAQLNYPKTLPETLTASTPAIMDVCRQSVDHVVKIKTDALGTSILDIVAVDSSNN
jgi:hypothetical protein